MNGAHDLGGMHGLGPIDPEPNEPVFHHAWEARAFATTMAAGFLGKWNIDVSRYAREQMPGPEYLNTTYYEHWLFGLERLVVERGLVTAEELRTRRAAGRAVDGVRVLRAADVGKVLIKGGTARRPDTVAPRFEPGAAVVTRNIHPLGHTRLPRYARGKRGVIDRDHGVFVFPDANGIGAGEKPQHCYSVRFTMRELWGDEASARAAVYIDLWDDHLEPA
jgi:nitrile hydratase beta subunit